jgi:N-acetylglucosamine-6-phosphate deacetylase
MYHLPLRSDFDGGFAPILIDLDKLQEIAADSASGTKPECQSVFFDKLLSDTPTKMRAALQVVGELPAGVLGIHFEGPFLSPEKPGVHHPAMLRCPRRTTPMDQDGRPP